MVVVLFNCVVLMFLQEKNSLLPTEAVVYSFNTLSISHSLALCMQDFHPLLSIIDIIIYNCYVYIFVFDISIVLSSNSNRILALYILLCCQLWFVSSRVIYANRLESVVLCAYNRI